MGIGVILHGYIECPGFGFMPECKRVYRANRRVILSLPISDPGWYPITRDMFSVLPLGSSRARTVAQYDTHIIHFGGVYKNMYILEAGWVEKFEQLLSRLCWYEAAVMLEFGLLRYEWKVPRDQSDRYYEDPPRPPTQWSFASYMIERRPMPQFEVVDRRLDSPYHLRPD